MSMLRWCPVPGLMTALVTLACPLDAQHAGHDSPKSAADSARAGTHLMAQLIPLVTRASPSAGGTPHAQWALTQASLMARTDVLRNRVRVDGSLNGERFTMPNGELHTGAYGEGFVDRRHPHTYLHELMLTLRGPPGLLAWSVSAGRGFVPFRTDAMMRPLVKYPINHHLAQILERATIAVAMRSGPVVLEGATFGGDEPSEPSSLPRANRFGDSWSVRATLLPTSATEVQASYARVTSPEELDGLGLESVSDASTARRPQHQRDHALACRSRPRHPA